MESDLVIEAVNTGAAVVPPGPRRPWLVADIGGTNARFGWYDGHSAAVSHVHSVPAAAHAGPAEAAVAYLDDLRTRLGDTWQAPGAAAFAVATAVSGDEVRFTNSGWSFSRRAAAARLGLADLRVLNDFEALALSLPRLAPEQWRDIPGRGAAAAQALPGAALAVIGPGTGLGVAGLVPTAHGYVALPGEGGHATLAPADDFESALLSAARRLHPHVSAERLLSGIGLPVLHAAVCAVRGDAPSAMVSAEDVVERGLAGHDAACVQALDSFCALLGSFAGSVALTLGARGGVYIGGGIVPRLGPRFFASRFRERFEAKGRFESYLQAIPTRLIVDTLAALAGCAAALES
jgi:glucokinase